jgi:hypothetical protein
MPISKNYPDFHQFWRLRNLLHSKVSCLRILPLFPGLYCATILAATSPVSPAQDAPSGLLCNLLTHPEKCVITESRPDFGWIVNSNLTDDLQMAYQILVASSESQLKKETGDLWNSGKVASSQSINVLYDGKPLTANSSYWWCVRTWNKEGQPSALSPQQSAAYQPRRLQSYGQKMAWRKPLDRFSR